MDLISRGDPRGRLHRIEKLAYQNKLFYCLECGKCTASCPMYEIFTDFSYELSPRGIIEKVILGSDSFLRCISEVGVGGSRQTPTESSGLLSEEGVPAILNDKSIWYCLTCDVCTEGCPAGVKFRDFIKSLRQLAIEVGVQNFEPLLFCKRCGNYFLPTHTLEYLRETLSDKKVSLDWLLLCPKCRKYAFSQKVKELIPGSKQVAPRFIIGKNI